MVGAIPELRRRVLAVQGVVREPGRVRTPELGIVGRERELAELGDLVLDGDAAPGHRRRGREGPARRRVLLIRARLPARPSFRGTVPYLVDLSPLGEAGGARAGDRDRARPRGPGGRIPANGSDAFCVIASCFWCSTTSSTSPRWRRPAWSAR